MNFIFAIKFIKYRQNALLKKFLAFLNLCYFLPGVLNIKVNSRLLTLQIVFLRYVLTLFKVENVHFRVQAVTCFVHRIIRSLLTNGHKSAITYVQSTNS